MATFLAQQGKRVEKVLQLIYRRYIRMQELRMHIQVTAQEIGVDPPTGRTCHAWLDLYALESSGTISSTFCWVCPLGNHEVSLAKPLILERMETRLFEKIILYLY
jgi:hypothetical protein